MNAMRLDELVGSDLSGRLAEAERGIDIAGLTADSRAVEAGFLFVALPGTKADGAAFVGDALSRGAVAILAPPGLKGRYSDAIVLADANPRRALALAAARFYAPQPETIVAVTGTNGKTSVAAFVRQIFERLGHSAASIGTLGVMSDAFHTDFGMTTPGPVELHSALQQLKARGVEHVAMEASSHGLAQYRLDGVTLKAAAITNLTRDHLDYHATLEDYAYAKLRLFGEVMSPGGVAVINADASIAGEAQALSRSRGHRIFSVGARGEHLRLDAHVPYGTGQRLTLTFEGRTFDLDLPLAGLFQASNALVAAGLALAVDLPAEGVFDALRHLQGAPGRLELVARTPSGAAVYVDYAHTPDAIETVLNAVRPHVKGALNIVFGCGGDRDAGKRPQMGEIAARLADTVIVTDDNPRSEDPAAIRAAILAAAPGALEIADRAQAIAAGVERLGANDALVVAGKGHESGQIVKGIITPFNDSDEVRRAVGALGGSR